jgi:putative transposase
MGVGVDQLHAAQPAPRQASDAEERILLENYFLPGDLDAQIKAFVIYYNHRRYHESIAKPHLSRRLLRTRAGHSERERIKRQTFANRRFQHQLHAA